MQFTLWKQMYRSIFNPVNTWAESMKEGEKKTVECLCVYFSYGKLC